MAFALLAARPNSHPFQERQISLKEPVKIGRSVAKARPTQSNGIFDCKVLSRNHAVIWYENGKFMLQDTKSSNGTYVNNVRLSRGSEESEPCEIKSGDILQFGVEVVENSKNVTHGCIIGLVSLFHEDGSEATGSHEETSQGLLSLLTIDKNMQPHELWQLSQFLQDALHREQLLENKLATLQRMIANSHVASEDTFQGFMQEDKLLSRLETLENQLELVSKDMSDEDVQSELITYQEERLNYESSAKETLQRILNEKIEVLQKLSDLERMLSSSDDECTHLRMVYEKSQEDLNDLMEKHRQRLDEMEKVKEELASVKERHDSVCQQEAVEKQELTTHLDEAERRGSALAVEVESLQAECDFTKKQLASMKERLEQLQKNEEDSLEDPERTVIDLPFASDHATLEKDVQNKSAYIKVLKGQLSEVHSELQDQQKETEELKRQITSEGMSSNTECLLHSGSTTSDIPDLLNRLTYLEELQDLLVTTKESLLDIANIVNNDNEIMLHCNSWNDAVDFQSIKNMFPPDQLEHYWKSMSSCNDLVKTINGDLNILSKACEQVLPVKEHADGAGRSEHIEELSDSSSGSIITGELATAQAGMEEVRRQILILGDSLIEEQETNKKNKELAATLEQRLYEAHKHMNIEKLDKSLSYETLESARKLAIEMQQQASNYAKVAGHEKVGRDTLSAENTCLKMKITRLENECKKLKQENALLTNTSDLPKRGVALSSDSFLIRARKRYSSVDKEKNVTEDSNQQVEENSLTNDSLDNLSYSNEAGANLQKQSQLTNLVFMLFILCVAVGTLFLLGVINISADSLPLLDERTWTEIWEHLF